MKLHNHLSPELILLNPQVKDKWELLKRMVEAIVAGPFHPVYSQQTQAEILDAVIAREKERSTGLGKGFAFPHARMPGLNGFLACRAILEPKMLSWSLGIFGLILLGFFLSRRIRVEPGMIALAGGLLMAITCRIEVHHALQKVKWNTILFFIGLFILIGASANVVISQIAKKNHYNLSFMTFTSYGFPMMILSLLISTLYIYLRYFAFS